MRLEPGRGGGTVGAVFESLPITPRRAGLAVVAGLLIGVGGSPGDPIPQVDRFVPAKEVPDMTQNDPAGGFPAEGKMYCAPVAVSNSLMALFGEDLEWEGVTQYDLVRQLASVGYMNTHPKHGTHLNQLMRGVKRYVEERGVKDFKVRFQGCRIYERQFGPGPRRPGLGWIKAHLASGGAAWLLLGWYEYDPLTKEYKRIGAHWVTAVGFGVDEDGVADGEVLTVHDPAGPAGSKPQREYVRMRRLEEGTVVGAMKNQVFPARGSYRMEGGMHVHSDADCALLDGVVGLWIK